MRRDRHAPRSALAPRRCLVGSPAAPSSRLGEPRPLALERGIASWYGPGFHGRMTASGERYDMHAATAAHRTLPFGTVRRGAQSRQRAHDAGADQRSRAVQEGPDRRSLPHRRPRHRHGRSGHRAGGDRADARPRRRRPALRGAGRSVPEQALADALAARLRADYPEVAVRSDEVWHRVQLGELQPTRDDAEALARKLSRQGYAALVIGRSRPGTRSAPTTPRGLF